MSWIRLNSQMKWVGGRISVFVLAPEVQANLLQFNWVWDGRGNFVLNRLWGQNILIIRYIELKFTKIIKSWIYLRQSGINIVSTVL